jgi:hypothetical protein
MTEHAEQVATITWFRYQYPKFAKCLWAIPNGGVRHIGTAVKLKAEGGMAGVPDLFLMIPAAEYHGLFIEMKVRGGKVSSSQKEFMTVATAMGYKTAVCYGFDEAKEEINHYFTIKSI